VKRYRIFHPLWLSFYSPSLYRDVAENWTGVGFLYLLLLLALAWIHPIASLQQTASALLKTVGPAVLEQIPTISIRQGEVSIAEPQPYVIEVPGSDTPLAVIDTTGQTTPESTQAFLLLTKRQAILRKNLHETRTYDLAGIQDLTVDRSTAKRILDSCQRYLAILAYPIALAGSYVYRILQALIYAAIGLLFARLLKAPLEYPELLRLSSVAVTPAIVVDTLRGAAGIGSSLAWWSFCFLLSMGYLLFAVRVNSPAQAPERMTGPAVG
jgi:ABC-type Fe3+-siderophore transport system permease subunit